MKIYFRYLPLLYNSDSSELKAGKDYFDRIKFHELLINKLNFPLTIL